jgi:Zn-finger protein
LNSTHSETPNEKNEAWREHAFAFFTNTACEYFPCHKKIDPEQFNCLFCYCPLYVLGENCGGNFTYTERGIKNCTNCDFPHHKDHYGMIVSRFGEIVAAMKQMKQDKPD